MQTSDLTVRESLRISQVLDVLSLITNQNMSIARACEQVGISTGTYYNYLNSNKDLITEALGAIARVKTAQYVTLAAMKDQALNRLGAKIDSGTMSPGELVQATRLITEEMNRIEEDAGHSDDRERAAREHLAGLEQQQADSRLNRHMINLQPSADGSLNLTFFTNPDVVEGEFADLVKKDQEHADNEE